MIEDKERKDYQLKVINNQLLLLRQDMHPEPKSSSNSKAFTSNNNFNSTAKKGSSGSALYIQRSPTVSKSPESMRDPDSSSKNYLSTGKNISKAESLGMLPRSRNKC
jgi:hypothetical protein